MENQSILQSNQRYVTHIKQERPRPSFSRVRADKFSDKKNMQSNEGSEMKVA
jgi:hypothetical protein